MKFDEWSERQFGKFPSSVSLASQLRRIKDLRAELRELEAKFRVFNDREIQLSAARIAWRAAGGRE